MTVVNKFNSSTLENLCRILADAVSHREITRLLDELNIDEIDSNGPRWNRLLSALQARQNHEGHSNNTLRLICVIVNPRRFVNNNEEFLSFLSKINKQLAFEGLNINEQGQPIPIHKARTISEAEERADDLRAELRKRFIHEDVLEFCKAEFLDRNYFHCILESAKSVAQKIRDRTGIQKDGADLFNEVFSLKNPILTLNALQTESEKKEQTGFSNYLTGIFGMYRNVTAHEPKIIYRPIDKREALDVLTMISFAHRRIDNAILVPK